MTTDVSQMHVCTPLLHGPQNTGYTYAHSSSYSSKALDYERENNTGPAFSTPRMSRRSLRLHAMDGRRGDESPADLSLNRSIGYSSSASGRRESRMLRKQKERQQPPQSNVQLLLSTPLKSQGPGSLRSCTASDASLLSSVLDESSTLAESFWDHTLTAGCSETADHSVVSSSSGNIHSAQTQTTMVSGYICGDCQGERRDAPSAPSSPPPPSSTVYCRKNKPGALPSLSNTCLRYGRKAAAAVVSIVTVLLWTLLPKIYRGGKGVLTYLSGVVLRVGSNAAAASATLTQRLTLTTGDRGRAAVDGVYSGNRGNRNARGVTADGKMTGPLWKAATGVFRWVGTTWYQLASLMSLLDVFVLTRCLPKLYRLLLFLLPLLLFLGLWHWGPSSLPGFLPIGVTQWRVAPATHVEVDSVEGTSRQAAVAPAQSVTAGSSGSERLAWLERRLEQLWEDVQLGGRRRERLHADILAQQQALRERMEEITDRAALGRWVSDLMEQRLAALRAELQQGVPRAMQSSASRLAELEQQLRTLETKTEEVLRRRATLIAPPASAAVAVQGDAHRTLMAQVQRLEAELGRVRQDLQGVMGCQGRCQQLDALQETVSAQMRQELRMLFFGPERGHEVPEPLLPWLSAHFARSSDLQGTLLDLERSILRNVSLRSERSGRPPCPRTVADAVGRTAGAAGMSEEQVRLVVKNALKLYSQDRTGLADFALESGGGSILSTRCSETFETKTALMSLFGLPLWYFTQSPRVVIQPDVHPGNCWAFKGSQGYLVIRLSTSVFPTAFSLEHVPKALSPAGNISSAPRHFSVYGLEDEQQDEGKLLGSYTYAEDGDSLQTFPATEDNDQAFQIIELRVLSNWGHPHYTCLYRFRVHGEPRPT
ncbi:SUN domain-containing protein 1-like [Scleropages formosus]|uniref:SUN domain-containing protein 1-like n=1 Tax=Scleropages formosus TaxID=113540 RepID=UPI0010FAA85A|nr:SUN domain-containing protein 1-like [Scleropages formosus]